MPNGSRTPINFFPVITTKEYPPWIWNSTSISLSTKFVLFDRAISWIIISVSEVLWKIAPLSTNLCLNDKLLVKFPLCAIERPPLDKSAKKGCTFLKKVFPDVAYLLWPIACLPGNLFMTSFFVKLSPTKPSLFSK